MSEPIDDKAFEEYLGRESQLSKRYRALGSDEVPAQLDGLILAQAREAVAARPASSRKKPAWMRWTPPLALAASMVLVISIVIESGTRQEVTMRDMATMSQSAPAQEAATVDDNLVKQETDAPAAQPRQLSAPEPEQSVAAAAPEAPQMQARKRADAVPSRDSVTVELQRSVNPPAFVSESPAASSVGIASASPSPEMKIEVPPPAPVPAVITAADLGNAEGRRREASAAAEKSAAAERDAASLDEIAVTGNRVEAARGAGQGAGPRGTVTLPRSREVSEEALLQQARIQQARQQARESDPQRWLEYIRELRRENKGRQADREWRSFIKAYPDYAVDEKDVARAGQ